MGYFDVPVPERPPVPEGKTRICIAGFGVSPNVARARAVATEIAKAHPDKYETWFYFSTFGYLRFLKDFQAKDLPEEYKDKPCSADSNPKTFATQTSAPLVFFQTPEGALEPKGGQDLFSAWAVKEFPDNAEIAAAAKIGVSLSPTEMFYPNEMPQGTYLLNKDSDAKE